MAESYPLLMPASNIRGIKIIARDTVGVSASPFTGSQQVFRHQAQSWEADITLTSMARDESEEWLAFILRLRGQFGTFLLGDPLGKVPRGSASTNAGTPVVNGANQKGDTLNITGIPVNAGVYLKVGDYIQLGSASTASLHKVLEQVSPDASGEAALNLWPAVHSTHADQSPVVVYNAMGNFRLASNESGWSERLGGIYDVTFGAVEAQ